MVVLLIEKAVCHIKDKCEPFRERCVITLEGPPVFLLTVLEIDSKAARQSLLDRRDVVYR